MPEPEHHQKPPFLPSCCETNTTQPKVQRMRNGVECKENSERFQKQTPPLRAMSWLMSGLVWWWITQLISVSSGASALAISGPAPLTEEGVVQPSYPNVARFCLRFWSHPSLCWCVNTNLSESLPTACGFQLPCSSVCQAGKSTCQLFGGSADRKLNTRRSARGFCLLLWLLWRGGACVLQLWRCIQVLLGQTFLQVLRSNSSADISYHLIQGLSADWW